MRVTHSLLFNQIRHLISRNSSKLLAAQEVVASQKRINRLSDDAVQAPRLLDVKSSQARLAQYLRNLDRADSLVGAYDTPLAQTEDLLGRVKELMLAEANEVSSTPATREAARIEIATLTSELVQIANTNFEGRYIFSGFDSTTPAFSNAAAATTAGAGNTGSAAVLGSSVVDYSQTVLSDFQIVFTGANTYDVVNTTTGSTVVNGATFTAGQPIQFNGIEVRLGAGAPAAGDTFDVSITPPGIYQGDSGEQRIEIQEGTFVQQNIAGNRVFQGAGATGGVDIFAILTQANTALATNDRTAIDAALSSLDTAREQVSAQRAAAGARQNLVKSVSERQKDLQIGLETVRSGIEDADLTEAITKLTQQQTAYEATLGAAARIADISLLDFLR
jgi:flagellar hook-associated protein 3 FlgL